MTAATRLVSKRQRSFILKAEGSLEPGKRVAMGDLVRIKYADHVLFVNQDPELFRQPRILDTTGRVQYLDDEVIMLSWETFTVPTEDGPKRRASGVTIHRATIIELLRLS